MERTNVNISCVLKKELVRSLILSYILLAICYIAKILPLYLCITGFVLYTFVNILNFYLGINKVTNFISLNEHTISNNLQYHSFLRRYKIVTIKLSYIAMFLVIFLLKCIS